MKTAIETFVNISLTAGLFTVAILAIRLLFKKAPKSLIMIMWALVAIRLLCPFTINTDFGVMPEKVIEHKVIQPEKSESKPEVVYLVMGKEAAANKAVKTSDIDPYKIAGAVWAIGAVAMITAGAVSYIRLQRRTRAKIRIDGNVYVCDDIDTPFVIGMFSPKIIIPSGMDKNALEHVLNHEKVHIRHKDNIWKPLGYLLLSLNWFNPLIWLAYIFFCKDMELYCDEAVIRNYSKERSADYLQTLLSLSTSRNPVAALAFGEVGVGYRIKSIIRHRKPTIAAVVLCVLVMTVTSACFFTNKTSDETTAATEATTAESEATEESIEEIINSDSDFLGNVVISAYDDDIVINCPSEITVKVNEATQNADDTYNVKFFIQDNSAESAITYSGTVDVDKADMSFTSTPEYEFYGSDCKFVGEEKVVLTYKSYKVDSNDAAVVIRLNDPEPYDPTGEKLDNCIKNGLTCIADLLEKGNPSIMFFKFEEPELQRDTGLMIYQYVALIKEEGNEDVVAYGEVQFDTENDCVYSTSTSAYKASEFPEPTDDGRRYEPFTEEYLDPSIYDSAMIFTNGDQRKEDEFTKMVNDDQTLYVYPLNK